MGVDCSCYNNTKMTRDAVKDINVTQGLDQQSSSIAPSHECISVTQDNPLENIIKVKPKPKLQSNGENNALASKPPTEIKQDPKQEINVKPKPQNQLKVHPKRESRKNSAFLNRTNIQVGIFGYFQSGKKSFVQKVLNANLPNNPSPNKLIEIERSMKFEGKNYDMKCSVCPFNSYECTNGKAFDFLFIFFDITSSESFEFAKEILKSHIKDKVKMYNTEDNSHFKSNCFLIGNKNDLCNDSTPAVNIDSFLKKNKYLHYYQLSSLVKDTFDDLLRKVFEIFDYNVVVTNFGVTKVPQK